MTRVNASIKRRRPEESDLFSRIVSDRVITEAKSEADVEEEVLVLSGLLPENKNARHIMINYVYNGDGNIIPALREIFSYNCAGTHFKGKYSNLRPVVEYAYHIISDNNMSFSSDNGNYLGAQMYCLKSFLHRLGQTEKETGQKQLYKTGEIMLQHYIDTLDNLNYADITELILRFWDSLAGQSATYRLLYGIMRSARTRVDTPEARNELLEIVSKLSKNWDFPEKSV